MKTVRSCNTLNGLSNKVCVSNKTNGLNLSVLNMITGINKSETLTKHVSYKCKCKLYGRKSGNSNQKWNKNKCWYKWKKFHISEKDYIWIPAICSLKNGKYLASIIGNSVIACNETTDARETITVTRNFRKKCSLYKNSIFYLNFC